MAQLFGNDGVADGNGRASKINRRRGHLGGTPFAWQLSERPSVQHFVYLEH
jgi:hypothetical protein